MNLHLKRINITSCITLALRHILREILSDILKDYLKYLMTFNWGVCLLSSSFLIFASSNSNHYFINFFVCCVKGSRLDVFLWESSCCCFHKIIDLMSSDVFQSKLPSNNSLTEQILIKKPKHMHWRRWKLKLI